MRGRRRIGSLLVGVIGALTIGSSALGASPWWSIRQQGVGAISQHIACTENNDDTLSCEAEILEVFDGKLKISGSPTLHGEQVCYERITATIDAGTEELLEAQALFGCAFDAGTIRVRSLSSIVLRSTDIELVALSCDASGCTTDDAAGDVTVRGKWSGVGRAMPSHERFRLNDVTCMELIAIQGRARLAGFSGTADGVNIVSDGALAAAGTFKFRTSCLAPPI